MISNPVGAASEALATTWDLRQRRCHQTEWSTVRPSFDPEPRRSLSSARISAHLGRDQKLPDNGGPGQPFAHEAVDEFWALILAVREDCNATLSGGMDPSDEATSVANAT